jgi:integrase
MKLYPKARYTDSTRNTCVLKPARAVINHAHDRGLCPPIRVKGFREAIVERPAGDRAWIEKFRTVAWEMEPRLAVMALLMFSTAARIGECIALEPEHLKLDEKKIIGPPGKNGDPGIFHLTDEVVEELRGLTPKAIRYGKGPVRVWLGYQGRRVEALERDLRARRHPAPDTARGRPAWLRNRDDRAPQGRHRDHCQGRALAGSHRSRAPLRACRRSGGSSQRSVRSAHRKWHRTDTAETQGQLGP